METAVEIIEPVALHPAPATVGVCDSCDTAPDTLASAPPPVKTNGAEDHGPRHVAIIMDGNGRWAAARHLPRYAGHAAGIAAVRRTVEESCRSKIDCLTLYAFSTENWKRPGIEIAALWELLARFLVCERAELLENNIRLTAIGRRDRLPLGPRGALELTEQMTASCTGLRLRLAVDYGARWALAEAARTLAVRSRNGELNPAEIDASMLERELSSGPPVDLLIRTGGELRLSNFLLWECAYAELWFTDVLWPDFEVETFQQAISAYQGRNRRFGDVRPLSSAVQLANG